MNDLRSWNSNWGPRRRRNQTAYPQICTDFHRLRKSGVSAKYAKALRAIGGNKARTGGNTRAPGIHDRAASFARSSSNDATPTGSLASSISMTGIPSRIG